MGLQAMGDAQAGSDERACQQRASLRMSRATWHTIPGGAAAQAAP